MSKREFHVYYQKGDRFGDFMFDNKKLTGSTIEQTHVFLKFVLADDLEDLFKKMQGENWSPNGEARELIQSKDLRHTSMSVGDVVYDSHQRKWFKVAMMGFDEIPYQNKSKSKIAYV